MGAHALQFVTEIIICYLPAGRSVWGKTVPVVFSTARSRRPRAVLKTEGTVFPYTDRPRPVNNISIFSNICELTGQSLKVVGTRVSLIESGVRKLGSECNHKLLKLLSLSLIFSTKDYPIIWEKVVF